MPDTDPHDTIREYKIKFGDTPTLSGLDAETLARAAKLLQQAIDTDVPYEDDADFYEALGMEPPEEGALT